MIFITFKVLNLVRSARNRLRPVWITFGIVYCVFPNTLKVPLQVFRYCSIFKVLCTLSLSADSSFIIPQIWFLSSFIFWSSLFFLNLCSRPSLGFRPEFRSHIGSFIFASQQLLRSHSLSPRLVLEYNTTSRLVWQAFFRIFLLFFDVCIHLTVFVPVKVWLLALPTLL